MSTIDLTQPIGDIVTAHPGAAAVFERAGLDYCCKGRRSMESAATEAGLDPRVLMNEIIEAGSDRLADTSYAQLGLRELVDHVESTHHAYLHAEFPRLVSLTAKIAEVHGSRHPELQEVARLTLAIRDDLEPHMAREELILFPMIREMVGGTSDVAPSDAGSVEHPIARMMAEHEATGALLEQLRSVTGGYKVPADGCATYHAAFQGLEQLERDTHVHIHKENNVMFPAALAKVSNS